MGNIDIHFIFGGIIIVLTYMWVCISEEVGTLIMKENQCSEKIRRL